MKVNVKAKLAFALIKMNFKHLFTPSICNAGNSDKKYGGMREDASVTVQGSKSKFNHITMQLLSPGYYISI